MQIPGHEKITVTMWVFGKNDAAGFIFGTVLSRKIHFWKSVFQFMYGWGGIFGEDAGQGRSQGEQIPEGNSGILKTDWGDFMEVPNLLLESAYTLRACSSAG